MEFRILGSLEVLDGDRRVRVVSGKQAALLTILLLRANEVVSTDRLIDQLWGEEAPETAPKALQVLISQLRKALEPCRAAGDATRVLVTQSPGYLLRVGPGELDAERFERLLEDGRRARADGDPVAAAALLREALALWRGEPLADFPFEGFAQTEIARLGELRMAALEERAAADLELGRHAELVPELEAALAQHPLRERLRVQFMLALYRSGRQAKALDAYRDGRRLLVEELGIEPGPELRGLEEAILRQDAGLLGGGPAPRAPAGTADRREGGPGAGFVGRGPELQALLAGVDRARSGRGALFLVQGEPGIGKTRLADEFAGGARHRGALVLWGRCWEAGGAPAYWPWVQALRSYARDREHEALRAELGAAAADVAQMLPELRELLPDLDEPPSMDPEAARFRVFDATSSFLRCAARVQPLVVVLDDLHVADTPSLLFLRFLAGELAGMRLVVLGAYRDAEIGSSPGLASTVAELEREPVTRRLSLGGLSRTEVGSFIELATGRRPPDAVIAAVHDETEGNPLFVGELVRLLSEEGRLQESDSARLVVPTGVRGVIRGRLGHLSDGCRHALTLAAALGREFSLDALARLHGASEDELLERLDEAIEARLVGEVPGAPHRLRFSHALVRDGLYEELPRAARARLHRRIGTALEGLYAADPDPHLAELAHHFVAAGAAARDRAVDYARRAGDRATALLAYEEAARLYRMALETMEFSGGGEERTRCELLLALGEALTSAGDMHAAKEQFLRGADCARRAGLEDQFARATLGYGGRYIWVSARQDRRLVPLLEEALQTLPQGDSLLRARLLARLAGALRDQPSREPRVSLSEEAVAMARRLGDPVTLGYALDARCTAVTGPDVTEELIATSTEVVHLAEAAGDAERAFFGHLYRLLFFLDVGQVELVGAELHAIERLADELRQPGYRWGTSVIQALLALFEGRFEAAHELIAETLTLGERAQSWNAVVSYRLQTFVLSWEQGRLEEVEELVRRSVEEYPSYPVWRCVLAGLYAELGREPETRRLLEELAADRFASLPLDEEWLLGMTLLAHACAFLRDDRHAATLYELLAPYAGKNVVSYPEVSLGSVSRGLGMLAAVMGRLDDAARHFQDAIEMNERMGARPWAAHARHGYAEALIRRDAPGDRQLAAALLDEAVQGYRDLGMTAWAELARAATALSATRRSV